MELISTWILVLSWMTLWLNNPLDNNLLLNPVSEINIQVEKDFKKEIKKSEYIKPNNVIDNLEKVDNNKVVIKINKTIKIDNWDYLPWQYAVFEKEKLNTILWLAEVEVISINHNITKDYIKWSFEWWKIVSVDVDYEKAVQNWFSKWYCTWFVAKELFPYISSNRQDKLWNWDAKERYSNASNAWYDVWQLPIPWSIAVFRWFWYSSSAWHVWIVLKVDTVNNKILIKDMNMKWKYKITTRWEEMSHKWLIWYIYL